MTVSVELPVMLKELTGLQEPIEVEGSTIFETLKALKNSHPSLGLHLFDENGNLRQHLRCCLNEEIVHDAWEMKVSHGDHLTLVHAVAGG